MGKREDSIRDVVVEVAARIREQCGLPRPPRFGERALKKPETETRQFRQVRVGVVRCDHEIRRLRSRVGRRGQPDLFGHISPNQNSGGWYSQKITWRIDDGSGEPRVAVQVMARAGASVYYGGGWHALALVDGQLSEADAKDVAERFEAEQIAASLA